MSDIKERHAQNDNTYLNYMALSTMLTKAMQEYDGRHKVNFDRAADLAWKVTQQLDSSVLLKSAEQITVEEIMQSGKVRQSALSRCHDITYAKKEPQAKNMPSVNWLVVLNVVVYAILAGFIIYS